MSSDYAELLNALAADYHGCRKRAYAARDRGDYDGYAAALREANEIHKELSRLEWDRPAR